MGGAASVDRGGRECCQSSLGGLTFGLRRLLLTTPLAGGEWGGEGEGEGGSARRWSGEKARQSEG